MKTKKICKTLKQLKKYCDERGCSECVFHKNACILIRLPTNWYIPEIKRALERIENENINT